MRGGLGGRGLAGGLRVFQDAKLIDKTKSRPSGIIPAKAAFHSTWRESVSPSAPPLNALIITPIPLPCQENHGDGTLSPVCYSHYAQALAYQFPTPLPQIILWLIYFQNQKQAPFKKSFE